MLRRGDRGVGRGLERALPRGAELEARRERGEDDGARVQGGEGGDRVRPEGRRAGPRRGGERGGPRSPRAPRPRVRARVPSPAQGGAPRAPQRVRQGRDARGPRRAAREGARRALRRRRVQGARPRPRRRPRDAARRRRAARRAGGFQLVVVGAAFALAVLRALRRDPRGVHGSRGVTPRRGGGGDGLRARRRRVPRAPHDAQGPPLPRRHQGVLLRSRPPRHAHGRVLGDAPPPTRWRRRPRPRPLGGGVRIRPRDRRATDPFDRPARDREGGQAHGEARRVPSRRRLRRRRGGPQRRSHRRRVFEIRAQPRARAEQRPSRHAALRRGEEPRGGAPDGGVRGGPVGALRVDDAGRGPVERAARRGDARRDLRHV